MGQGLIYNEDDIRNDDLESFFEDQYPAA